MEPTSQLPQQDPRCFPKNSVSLDAPLENVKSKSSVAVQQLTKSFTPQPPGLSYDQAKSPRGRAGRSKNRQRLNLRKAIEDQDEEDAVLQDYIDNMVKDEDEEDDTDDGGRAKNKAHRRNETFRFYDGAAEAHVKVQTTKQPTKRKSRPPAQAIDWSSTDLEDFDDLDTTDEEITEVDQVLRHRQRSSGIQYLVTEVGRTTSDAKWVLQSKLTSESARDEIKVYEEIREMQIEVESEDSESMSTGAEEAMEDLNGDIESEMEENDLIFEHTQRMTDEEIARILAKQEELGMGGDQVVLFDGETMGDSTDGLDTGAEFIPFSVRDHLSNRTRSKRNKKSRDSFPSAEAFAEALDQDPYGAFDIMDFDRPSLRPKRKGKGNASFPFDLDLSDEDLKERITSTWMKDREKKAARKREKMEARAALLLEAGERSSPAAIKAEIRHFLVSEDMDTLKLAPMEAHLRASVHRLAKSLKLHSRSEGKEGVGAGRLPVLTKSPQTPHYTSETIWEIDALMNLRKFFPKNSGGGSYKGPRAANLPAGSSMRKGRDRGGGGFSAASYANGEVVGASAPELGSENRGRAMLEKMGWVSGMGIGKEGNQGGLEHVKHVVKTGKAGLG
jgi:hypothetical protein